MCTHALLLQWRNLLVNDEQVVEKLDRCAESLQWVWAEIGGLRTRVRVSGWWGQGNTRPLAQVRKKPIRNASVTREAWRSPFSIQLICDKRRKLNSVAHTYRVPGHLRRPHELRSWLRRVSGVPEGGWQTLDGRPLTRFDRCSFWTSLSRPNANFTLVTTTAPSIRPRRLRRRSQRKRVARQSACHQDTTHRAPGCPYRPVGATLIRRRRTELPASRSPSHKRSRLTSRLHRPSAFSINCRRTFYVSYPLTNYHSWRTYYDLSVREHHLLERHLQRIWIQRKKSTVVLPVSRRHVYDPYIAAWIEAKSLWIRMAATGWREEFGGAFGRCYYIWIVTLMVFFTLSLGLHPCTRFTQRYQPRKHNH